MEFESSGLYALANTVFCGADMVTIDELLDGLV